MFKKWIVKLFQRAFVKKTPLCLEGPFVAIDTEHLEALIHLQITKHGNSSDLNCIDVSYVTDMHGLFRDSHFNGDISAWNTSRVINMSFMFYGSCFAGNLSTWNTSSVTNMQAMFFCSVFNSDIGAWDVSNVRDMRMSAT